MNTVVRHTHGCCAVLTLARPDALNAITNPMLAELDAHLSEIAGDATRALILTGQGRAFCAGSDLKERRDDVARRLETVHALVERLQQFPKISVAAINGAAFGGGLELAMACTFRVAHASARLGLPEIKLGVMPVYGGTQLLPRLIGERRALRMMLDGEPVDADTALAWGLVDRTVAAPEALLDSALELATACSRYGLLAQQGIRQALREGMRLELAAALRLEREIGARVAATNDAREGVRAFVEKCAPLFSDS